MENIDILIIMSGITFLYYMKKEHDNRYKAISKDKSSKNNSKEKLSSKNKLKKSDESTEVLNKKIKDYNNMKYIINSIQRLNK